MAKFYAAQTESKCYVPFGAIKLLPATFTSSVISFSVLIQTVLFILTASMADYGRMRKRMLIGTAYAGGILTCSYLLMFKVNLYVLAGLLLILTNVLFGYSVIFYNAFLPHLVRTHPETQILDKDERTKALDKLTNKLSANSFMMGHVSGIIVLLISVPIVYFLDSGKKVWYDCSTNSPVEKEDTDSLFGLRLSVFIVGAVWIAITIFTMVWLKPRPGPQLPPGKNYLTASISSVIGTVKKIKKLKNTFLFLLAYFIFSDAYNTIASVGILFAKTDLNASSMTLVIMLIEVPFVAVIGNFFWLWIKNKFNIETKTMLYFNLGCLLILPIYGFIGFIPKSPIGIKHIWELYVFAAIFGFNLSAIQSFARSLFIALTPPGKEAEFFGFYELTDKGSAWIGPAVVAVLTQSTGQVRYAFIFLFVTLLLPFAILYFVNVEEGIESARSLGEGENSVGLSDIASYDETDEEDEMVSLEEEEEEEIFDE